MVKLKFRIWNNDEKRYMDDYPATISFIENKIISVRVANRNYMIEQYTGLKDKYGTDIYDNDLLAVTYYTRTEPISTDVEIVKFDELLRGYDIGRSYDNAVYIEYVVIGNINQNAEKWRKANES